VCFGVLLELSQRGIPAWALEPLSMVVGAAQHGDYLVLFRPVKTPVLVYFSGYAY
jgi:hypothetical protein